MKNKYQRLDKEDKKECREMYYSTPKGLAMRLRLIRLLIIGTLGILVSTYMLGNCIITSKFNWYDLLMMIPLFIASVVFLVGSFYIRTKVLNQFALKIPKFKNKRV